MIAYSPRCYSRPCPGTGNVTTVLRGARPRSGWSLIEMVVTLSVFASLTGVAATTIGSLLRAERGAIQHVSHLLSKGQIGRQFRQDAHQAREVQVATEGTQEPVVTFQLGDGHQVRYVQLPEGLQRIEERTGQPVRNEVWRLNDVRLTCTVETGTPRLVTLRMVRTRALSKPTEIVPRELEYVAAVGRSPVLLDD